MATFSKKYLLTCVCTLAMTFPSAYTFAQDAAVPEELIQNEQDLQQSLPVENDEAEEEIDAEQAAPEPEQVNITMTAGPKLRELEEYTVSLLNGLEPAQAQYIYNIRQNFGIIRSVQVVRGDIEKAVESCGEANTDMKQQITSRFDSWNDVIVPKLAVADVALKDAVQRQSFRPTVRVTMLLDLVQSAFEERDVQIKKVPVSTPEACKSLLESLDETEESLQDLMDSTISDLNKLSADPEQTATAS